MDERTERAVRNIIARQRVKATEEFCVLCLRVFGYPKTLPAHHSLRHGNYVHGSGQLCDTCAVRVYKETEQRPRE